MPNSNFNKFFISIVAPSILAIVLFVISFFVIIIPQFEKSMMDQKKEMIRELTNSAWSIMQEQNASFIQGKISLDSAQVLASHQIELMRYGIERKDYFWIIDSTPVMIMHPYRKELNGSDLSTFTDSHEKKLFVDATNIIKKSGQGFIDYYWQWKDDTSRVVPKISYVKVYEPWQWIIGTGIYLEDVREEIATLKNRLLAISSIIILIIVIALVYIVRQSLNIENKRKAAEMKLILSRQKYKALVQASTEGTLMLVEGKVIFNNLKFAQLVGNEANDFIGANFNDLFSVKWEELSKQITDPNKTISTETDLIISSKQKKSIILSVSRVEHSKQQAFILVVKDISRKVQLEKSAKKLSDELHSSLLLMNQPIKQFVQSFISCALNTPVMEAANQMSQKNQKVIFVKQQNEVIGTVNESDLKNRVIATNISNTTPISQVMSSPVMYINEDSLLFEAVLLFKRKRVSHLLVKDSSGSISGVISNQEVLEMQRNSVTYLIQEIETSFRIDELEQIYNRVPVLVNSIIPNSDNAQSTTRIITSVADAITKRVIDLAIDNVGTPPCKFAFVAMGSEGRMEQTLKTDQDNALIFEDTENNNNFKNYFLELAETVNNNLHKIGYQYCDGGIMAMNPIWCLPLSGWKKQFSKWSQSPDPKSVLDSSIFFDLRFIYGEQTFVDELHEHIFSEITGNTLFFYHMANGVLSYKPSISSDDIHLKKVILPIVGFMRIYALKNQLKSTNTLERLLEIEQLKIITNKQSNDLIQIYNFLMQKRLKLQAEAILQNEQPDNIVNNDDLSEIDKNTLKKAMHEIGVLQLKLRQDF